MREFVMGTNDGSRNFSANCDLKRSMSSDGAGLREGNPENDSASNNRKGQLAQEEAYPIAPLFWHILCSYISPEKRKKRGETLPHCLTLRVQGRP